PELLTVALVQHPQVDDIRIVRLVALLVDRREVEWLGVCPLLLEPFDHAAHGVRMVMAKVELGVLGESGICEVRTPRDDAVLVGCDHKGLAVEEPAGEPSYLHASASEPLAEPASNAVRLVREAEQVPV